MNVTLRLLPCRNAYLHSSSLRQYAVKAANPAIAGLGKKSKDKGGAATKLKMEVEKDPHKLVNYVCGSNIMQTGEDIKLKPDNEYPDWLWNVDTGPKKKLHELEPGTKQYLELLKRMNIKKALKLRNLSKIKQN